MLTLTGLGCGAQTPSQLHPSAVLRGGAGRQPASSHLGDDLTTRAVSDEDVRRYSLQLGLVLHGVATLSQDVSSCEFRQRSGVARLINEAPEEDPLNAARRLAQLPLQPRP